MSKSFFLILTSLFSCTSFGESSFRSKPILSSGFMGLKNPKENESSLHISSEQMMLKFLEVLQLIQQQYINPDVSNAELFKKALKGLLSLDPHSDYLDQKEYKSMCEFTEGEFAGIGVQLFSSQDTLRVMGCLPDTPAARAGLKMGDIVVAIGQDQSEKNRTLVAGVPQKEAIQMIRGKPGTTVYLWIKREGEDDLRMVALKRVIINIDSVKWEIKNHIGYISLRTFDQKTTTLMKKALLEIKQKEGNKLKGYILDLRDNPGGLFDQAISVLNLFVGKGTAVSTRGKSAEILQKFSLTPKQVIAKNEPLVVLINSASASATEIVAAALQDHKRAVIVGENSFGKGSIQAVIPLSHKAVGDLGAIKLTTGVFCRPNGNLIQGFGVKPDVEVRPVIEIKYYTPSLEIRDENLRLSFGQIQEKESKKEKKENQPRKAKEILKNEENLKKKDEAFLKKEGEEKSRSGQPQGEKEIEDHQRTAAENVLNGIAALEKKSS